MEFCLTFQFNNDDKYRDPASQDVLLHKALETMYAKLEQTLSSSQGSLVTAKLFKMLAESLQMMLEGKNNFHSRN